MRQPDLDLIDVDASTYDAFARRTRDELVDRERERVRLRRGGPRAPLLLVPLIGLAAGIGIAYVAQAAHLTQAGYEESSLAGDQARLHQLDEQLGDELQRLRSPARIDAAAQRLGLKPPTRWTYVAAQPLPIAPARGGGAPLTSSGPGSPVDQVVEALLGSWTTSGGGTGQAADAAATAGGQDAGDPGATRTEGTAAAASQP